MDLLLPPQEESLTALHPALFCPRKAFTDLDRCLESLMKHNKKLGPGYLPSECASVPCCSVATESCPADLFVLEGTKYSLPNVFQERVHSFSVEPRGSPHLSILCKPYIHCFLSLSLHLSLASLCKMGSPALCNTMAFLSCSLGLQILHLPCSLPPVVQIFFLILTSIS